MKFSSITVLNITEKEACVLFAVLIFLWNSVIEMISKLTLVVTTVLIAGMILLGTVIPVEAIKGEGVPLLSTGSDDVCGKSLCTNPMSIQEKIDQYLYELKFKQELFSSAGVPITQEVGGPIYIGIPGAFAVGGVVTILAVGGVSGFLDDSGETNQLGIPDWVKNNADVWSKGLISDRDFVAGLGYMMKEKIIQIENVELDSEGSIVIDEDLNLPSWIKTTAEFWAKNKISDNEFAVGLEWLINNGVIRI